LRGRADGDPALDVALAAALLADVAAGHRAPALRVYRPSPTVAFGRRDAFLPGFARAAAAARRRGFTPVLRAQGGRAAAYDEDCVVLDEVQRSAHSLSGIEARFAAEAERHSRALAALGVDARVGEVPGEYCPGAFTVSARGQTKLVGSAQRIVRGGWLLSTVVVCNGSARLRAVLSDVYDALELSWDPQTVGSVTDEVRGVGIEDVEAALLASYDRDYRLLAGDFDAQLIAAARRELGRYRVASASVDPGKAGQ
jgi:octanoyl-[GcvH]:protein N-octanoyltransferase